MAEDKKVDATVEVAEKKAPAKKAAAKPAAAKKPAAKKATTDKEVATKEVAKKAAPKKAAPAKEAGEKAPVKKAAAPKAAAKAPAKKATAEGTVSIKLIRSLTGRKKDQVATAVSLSLTKVGRVSVQPDNAATKGKIVKISHLVEVSKA